ncbi:MAG TPA: APC family permease, partial [Acidobacteriaceae bacterium]|nr:APC family permease [Acidobacteriaceae bacterium]
AQNNMRRTTADYGTGAEPQAASSTLVRGIGLTTAVNLNVLNMIGVGPFITLPLMVAALGRLAILGWILGAALALCDGMIWAELGTRFPDSGGSYLYLNRLYGSAKWGRLLSFLYIWQLTFSAPLSTASGAVGLSQYAAYLFPVLNASWLGGEFHLRGVHIPVMTTWGSLVAMLACALATFLIYSGIRTVSRISRVLSIGVLVAVLWVIVSGLSHLGSALPQFHAHVHPAGSFSAGLLIAIYNYGGYYNICFLGGEVRDPRRIIPRAIFWSILIVAALYVFMNVSVLNVIPVKEFAQSSAIFTRTSVIAVMMQRLYGAWAGKAMAVLIVWTAFASVFAVLLGYSRVPYAAALDQNYFSSFAKIHPTKRFPTVSLIVLGGISVIFCMFRLQELISALIITRIVFQFLLQGIGLIAFRKHPGGEPNPFRMPWYPVPALLAIAGFLFVLSHRSNGYAEIEFAGLLLLSGLAIYLVRSGVQHDWPFR